MKKHLLLGSLGAAAALGAAPIAHWIPALAADTATTTINVTVANENTTIVDLEMTDGRNEITNGGITYNGNQTVYVTYQNAYTIRYILRNLSQPEQQSVMRMRMSELPEGTEIDYRQVADPNGPAASGVDEITFNLNDYGGYAEYILYVVVNDEDMDSIRFTYSPRPSNPSNPSNPSQPGDNPEDPGTPEDPGNNENPENPERPLVDVAIDQSTGDPSVRVDAPERAESGRIEIRGENGFSMGLDIRIDQSSGSITADIPVTVTDPDTNESRTENRRVEIGKVITTSSHPELKITVPFGDLGLRRGKYTMSISISNSDGDTIISKTKQFDYAGVPGVPDTGGLLDILNFTNADMTAILITVFVVSLLAGGLFLKKNRKSTS